MNKGSQQISKHQGGCWPTAEQSLLLRASLLQSDQAIEAWREWKERVDIDRLDVGSQRLLPLLYHNLRRHDVIDPQMKRLKGIYQSTWYKNQLLFHRMTALLQAFYDAGIEIMLLKGAALTPQHYKHYGLRPMSDFDILVRAEMTSRAVELLLAQGWRPKYRPLNVFNRAYFAVNHSHEFKSDNGPEIDLHWHVLHECCAENADDDFWANSVMTHLNDQAIRTLDATDHLFHACIHGVRWNPVPPVRWAADAKVILESSESEIDWDRLVAQAQRRDLVLPLRDALKYLRERLDARIPVEALRTLESVRPSRLAQSQYRLRSYPITNSKVIHFHIIRYAWLVKAHALRPSILSFLIYLQCSWGLDHLWQIPFYPARAIYMRLRQ